VAVSARKVLGGFLGAQIATGIGAAAINVLSARGLGPSGRGEVAFWLQVAVILGVVLVAGTDRAYPATLSAAPTFGEAVDDLRRLVAPGVAIVGGGCLLVVGALAAEHHRATWLIAMTGLVAIGSAIASSLRAAAAASGVSGSFVVAAITGQAALIASGVALLAIGVASPPIWLFAYAATWATPVLIAAAVASRSPQPLRRSRQLGKSRRLGARLMPSTAAGIIMLRADRLLLPALAGYTALGLYGTVATIAELIAMPVQSYVDSHIPTWRHAHQSGNLNRGRIVAVIAVYAAAATVTVTVTVRLLLVPIFGAQYQDAIVLAGPLAGAVALYAVSRAGVGLLLATEQPWRVNAVDIVAMAVAVSMYLLLIPRFGAMGAALGSLVGYGIGAAIALSMVVATRRRAAQPTAKLDSQLAGEERTATGPALVR